MEKEIRILLNESTFTQLCKTGFISFKDKSKLDIYITKREMNEIISGKILEKEVIGDIFIHNFKIALQDIGMDLIMEIIKRSPVYSEVALS